MFYEVAQQQEALWPQLDLSIAAAQGTAPEIERKSRKTIGFLADRLHRLALSLRDIGTVPWWRFQHLFRIFAPRFQAIVAVVVRSLHSRLSPNLTTAFSIEMGGQSCSRSFATLCSPAPCSGRHSPLLSSSQT